MKAVERPGVPHPETSGGGAVSSASRQPTARHEQENSARRKENGVEIQCAKAINLVKTKVARERFTPPDQRQVQKGFVCQLSRLFCVS